MVRHHKRPAFNFSQKTMDAFVPSWHTHTCTDCAVHWDCLHAHFGLDGACMHQQRASDAIQRCEPCQMHKDFGENA